MSFVNDMKQMNDDRFLAILTILEKFICEYRRVHPFPYRIKLSSLGTKLTYDDFDIHTLNELNKRWKNLVRASFDCNARMIMFDWSVPDSVSSPVPIDLQSVPTPISDDVPQSDSVKPCIEEEYYSEITDD